MSIIKKVIWLSALLMFFFAIQNLSASSFTNIAKLLGANNSDVTVGDIDNDGLIDVVVGGNLLPSGLTNILVIYKNLGNFNFTPIYTSRLYPADSNDRTGLALGDIDNDGDLDLVWEYYLNNIPHMVILKNNSSGNFSVSQNISSSAYPPTPILYDMNRDGTLDLVDNGIIYTNSGNGAFSSNQSLPSCISFAIGDFNKDGCPDIAFMSLDSWIYTNSGMGVLNKKYPFPKMNEGKISLGDVDADGNLDFIMTGRIGTPSTNFAKMIHNDGSGNFTVINNGFFPSTSGTSAAMGDIYNNGLIDLILSVDNTSGLKTYRNNITDKGTYVLEDSWPSDGYQNGSTIMANFNSDDNNLDFCVIGQYGNVNKLGIFKNLSSINNSRPNAPAGMEATNLGGFWRLKWDCVNSDDHTLMKQLMRYNIAIGTNSGHYNICSTNISYPRGSANIGNVVATFPNPYYQTKIPVTKNVYWKVCSIDSAFAHSAYCAEQEINFPPTPPVSGFFPSASVRVTNKGAIMFKWNPGSDPNLKDRPLLAYTVIVSTNSDVTNNILSSKTTGVGITSNELSLQNTSVYYWRVRARDPSSSYSAWSSVQSFTMTNIIPSPVFTSIEAQENNRIEIKWNRMPNVTSWTIFRNTYYSNFYSYPYDGCPGAVTNFVDTNSAMHTVTYNYLHCYWVGAYTPLGRSFSSIIKVISLAQPPGIKYPLNPPGESFYYTNSAFRFQNTNTGISRYHFNWDNVPDTKVTTNDFHWSPAQNASTNIMSSHEGIWYLHIVNKNDANVLTKTYHYGPFKHYQQTIGHFALIKNKNRIDNTGLETVDISTAAMLSNANIYSLKTNIKGSKKFNIRILEGECNLICSGTNNNGPYAESSPDHFSFKACGTVLNQVKLRVTWEGDANVFADVSFLISPVMAMGENDFVPFYNVLCPEKSDSLKIYVNCPEGENLTVRIYDINLKKLLKTVHGTGGYYKLIQTDLRLENGSNFPEGLYGIMVQGSGWKREKKLVVHCP